jgi:hypothetical protein
MTAPAPAVIEWVKRGQIIQAPSLGNAREPYMVFGACPDLFHAWYCEPCNQLLANVAQLEMHVETGGSHRLVVWCSKRRLYEAVDEPPVLQIGAGL